MNAKQRIKQLEKGMPKQTVTSNEIQRIVEELIHFVNTEIVEPIGKGEQNDNKQTDKN
jgi:hypothetical protein